jgi:hypothetical protein
MTIAKIAYLVSPGPGRYVLNFQTFGSDELTSIEVGPDQMKNILTHGVSLMLNSALHRVPLTQTKDADHERSGA